MADLSRFQLSKPTMAIREVKTLEGRIGILQDLVRKGIRNPVIYQLVREIVSRCPDRNDGCEIAQVFWYAKANVRCTQDIFGIDSYQAPQRTVQFKAGDCDDSSVLLCSMLGSIGYQTGFRVISVGGQVWEHIYALVGVPKPGSSKLIALDTTVPSSYPGWQPPAWRAKKDFFPIKYA